MEGLRRLLTDPVGALKARVAAANSPNRAIDRKIDAAIAGIGKPEVSLFEVADWAGAEPTRETLTRIGMTLRAAGWARIERRQLGGCVRHVWRRPQ
jgi:hypothetical protein